MQAQLLSHLGTHSRCIKINFKNSGYYFMVHIHWCTQTTTPHQPPKQPLVASQLVEGGGMGGSKEHYLSDQPHPCAIQAKVSSSSAHSTKGACLLLRSRIQRSQVKEATDISYFSNPHCQDLPQQALGVINPITGLKRFENSSYWKIQLSSTL